MLTWQPLNLLPGYPGEILWWFKAHSSRVGSVLAIRLMDLRFLFYMCCEVLTPCLEAGMGDPSLHGAVDSCECVS